MAATLDVIIPTHNRAQQLRRALNSLVRASVPEGLRPSILVVDNNSSDDTMRTVESAGSQGGPEIRYMLERRQGQVFARNAGIAATHGDLIAFIDDDEEVSDEWYLEIQDAFSDSNVEFVGGPYLAKWEVPPPDWVTARVATLLGSYHLGPEKLTYDRKLNAVLPGGNCVFRRTLLQRIGGYSPAVGHIGGRPLGNDDTELFERILDDGARGLYLPRMCIYHHIPSARITKTYARRLKFWSGVATQQIDRMRAPHVRRIAGIPAYLLGNVARDVPTVASTVLRARFHECFQYELELWFLAGFVYGLHARASARDVN